MANITIAPHDPATWVFRGSDVAFHNETVAANCRPPKSVVTQTIGPVKSACKSLDTCPPFVKNYHDWGVSISIYDFVDGIGLGCLLQVGGIKFMRRHTNTDNGSSIDGATAIANILDAAGRFAVGGPLVAADYFGTRSSTERACPDA